MSTSRVLVMVLFASACSAPMPNGNGDDGSSSDTPDASQGAPTDGAVAASDAGSGSSAPADAPAAPPITVLRGVDRAGAFSATEAKTLATSDAVKWTGVYIGGPCNAGSGWTKALVQSFATDLGWTFMPIYVGRQTSSICSADVLTAAQGTTDGDAAVTAMATFGWDANKNIPVCLDLEAGTYAANASGSEAYAKAWLAAVKAGGYLGYVYSNPTGINGLYGAGVKFDGAWPASWFYTSFENVSPSDLTQLTTGTYDTTNRAWQYASFTSSVGGIDADTSDLLLAPTPGGTNL
ncbi:MAG TPA: glycoside hydrolase domain-containing protein [Kofleriaceae bacterium]|nr:glycoside hydrolase domain-containing protein [Kofleriaceae bacterium]